MIKLIKIAGIIILVALIVVAVIAFKIVDRMGGFY